MTQVDTKSDGKPSKSNAESGCVQKYHPKATVLLMTDSSELALAVMFVMIEHWKANDVYKTKHTFGLKSKKKKNSST